VSELSPCAGPLVPGGRGLAASHAPSRPAAGLAERLWRRGGRPRARIRATDAPPLPSPCCLRSTSASPIAVAGVVDGRASVLLRGDRAAGRGDAVVVHPLAAEGASSTAAESCLGALPQQLATCLLDLCDDAQLSLDMVATAAVLLRQPSQLVRGGDTVPVAVVVSLPEGSGAVGSEAMFRLSWWAVNRAPCPLHAPVVSAAAEPGRDDADSGRGGSGDGSAPGGAAARGKAEAVSGAQSLPPSGGGGHGSLPHHPSVPDGAGGAGTETVVGGAPNAARRAAHAPLLPIAAQPPLVTVPLQVHQLQALYWMQCREAGKPHDFGMGVATAGIALHADLMGVHAAALARREPVDAGSERLLVEAALLLPSVSTRVLCPPPALMRLPVRHAG